MERRMARLQSSRGFSLEHEALLLREQYTELLRNEAVLKQPTAFQQLVREGETVCGELEKAFNRRAAHGATDKQSTVSNAIFERLKENCNNCHRQFRDVPLHVAE